MCSSAGVKARLGTDKDPVCDVIMHRLPNGGEVFGENDTTLYRAIDARMTVNDVDVVRMASCQ
eukprot:1087347-Amphidinium_carterae.1